MFFRNRNERVSRLIGVAATTVFLGIDQSALASGCFDSTMSRGESRSSVKLVPEIASPYFYFRSFDYNFAILVTPSRVQSALEAAASNGNRDAKALLELVGKDLPLTGNTDLFKYVLSDSHQLSIVQRVMVNFLERGEAAVFDAETGQLSPTIKVRHVNTDRARSRTFYAVGKTILLQSLDCIEN